MVFSFDSTIRYSEVDSKCVLTLEALTNYFQDCSVFQAESLNIGMDHRIWGSVLIISKRKIWHGCLHRGRYA